MALPGAVSDAAHPGAVLRCLDEQRGRGTFCDVTVIVGDHKFRAHRNVLAASSPYFYELLFARGSESGGGAGTRTQVLEISFARPEVFAEILNFIYSSKLSAGCGDILPELASSGEKLGLRFLAELEKSPDSADGRQAPRPAPEASGVKREPSETGDGPRILSSYSVSQTEKAAAAAPTPGGSLYDVSSLLPQTFTMALEHSYAEPPEPLRGMLNAYCQGRRDGSAEQACVVPGALPLFGCGHCPMIFDGVASLRAHERSHKGLLVQCEHCRRPFMSERLLRAHRCLLRPQLLTSSPPPPPPPPPPPASVAAEKSAPRSIVKIVMPVAGAGGPAGTGDGPPEARSPAPSNGTDLETTTTRAGVYDEDAPKPAFATTLRRRRPLPEPDHYVHAVDGQVLYFCAVCDRSYVQLTSLKRHSNVHSWSKQYPCRFCECVFALAEYRTKHEICHTGECRYQCIFCSEAFLTYHFLKTHQRAQHGIKPCKADGKGGAAAALGLDKVPLVRYYRLLPRQINKRLYRTYRRVEYGEPRGPGGGAATASTAVAAAAAAAAATSGLKTEAEEEDRSVAGSNGADGAAGGQITVSIADDRPDDEPLSPEPDLRPPKNRRRKQILWTRVEDAECRVAGRHTTEDDSDSDQEWKDSSWKPYYSYKPKRKGSRGGPRGRRRRRGWHGAATRSRGLTFGEARSPSGGPELSYATRRRSSEAESAEGRLDDGAARDGRSRALDPARGDWAAGLAGLAGRVDLAACRGFYPSRDDDRGDRVRSPGDDGERDGAGSAKVAALGFYTVDGRGVRRSAEDIAIAEKLLQMGELTPPPPPPVPAAYPERRDRDDDLLDLTFGKNRVADLGPAAAATASGPRGDAWPHGDDASLAKRGLRAPASSGAAAARDDCRGLDLSVSKDGAAGRRAGGGVPSPCSSDDDDDGDRKPPRLAKGMYPCVFCNKVFPFRCRWMKHQLSEHGGKMLPNSESEDRGAAVAAPGDDPARGDGDERRGLWAPPDQPGWVPPPHRAWEPGGGGIDGGLDGARGTDDERGDFKCFYCPRVLRTLASRSAHHTWHRRWLKAPHGSAAASDRRPLSEKRHRCPLCPKAFKKADSLVAHQRWHKRPAAPGEPAGTSWGGALRREKYRCCCCPRVLKTAAARALHQKSHRSAPPAPEPPLPPLPSPPIHAVASYGQAL